MCVCYILYTCTFVLLCGQIIRPVKNILSNALGNTSVLKYETTVTKATTVHVHVYTSQVPCSVLWTL